MAGGGRGGNTFEILVPLLFPFLSLSPLFIPHSFSGIGKEVRRGRQIVQKDVGVHKGDRHL
jgi:hypothetical protein